MLIRLSTSTLLEHCSSVDTGAVDLAASLKYEIILRHEISNSFIIMKRNIALNEANKIMSKMESVK